MSPQIPEVFSALSDPTRFAIVEKLLREGDQSVGDLARPFQMSAPAISRHLKILEDVGLIERRVKKQWRVCRLKKECFVSLDEWLERYRSFWIGSFDRLEAFLDQNLKEEDQ
tara:strand:+ start:11213 stop:11548 length:336 start_codon:yes stop_codon:yes gene_type:complete